MRTTAIIPARRSRGGSVTAIVARRYSQPSVERRSTACTRPQVDRGPAGRRRRRPRSGPAAIQGACRAGISSSTVRRRRCASRPRTIQTPARAAETSRAPSEFPPVESGRAKAACAPRRHRAARRPRPACVAPGPCCRSRTRPGQSETTPGSIGQKYSVSAETAWSRDAFGKSAPSQPVPVVAYQLPAADHERGHHEHDRDPQPDLGQLERGASCAARSAPSTESRSRTSGTEPACKSGHRRLPDRRVPDFDGGSRHGIVVHVDHPLVILFAVHPDRVAAVDKIADGLVARRLLHLERDDELLGPVAVVLLFADLERLDLLTRLPGRVAQPGREASLRSEPYGLPSRQAVKAASSEDRASPEVGVNRAWLAPQPAQAGRRAAMRPRAPDDDIACIQFMILAPSFDQ